MVKTITIFRKVEDFYALLNYYVYDVFPILHSIPGVLYSDIIQVKDMSPDCPEDLERIQVIMETYFESEKAVSDMLESEKGMTIMKKIESSPFECEQYVYLGKIKRFPSIHAHKNEDPHHFGGNTFK